LKKRLQYRQILINAFDRAGAQVYRGQVSLRLNWINIYIFFSERKTRSSIVSTMWPIDFGCMALC